MDSDESLQETVEMVEYELSKIDKNLACEKWIRIIDEAQKGEECLLDTSVTMYEPFTYKNFVLHIVENRLFYIEDLDKICSKLFADEDVCRCLIENIPDCQVVAAIDPSLKCNKEFMLFAAEKFPDSLAFASYALKNDIDVVIAALQADEYAADNIGKDLKEVIGQDDALTCLKSLKLSMKLEKDLAAANDMKPRTPCKKI
jgi:hypothetical protein